LHACVGYKLHYRFTWWHFTETVSSRREALWLRPLAMEVRVQFRISPCGTWVGQTGTGTDFSPHNSVFLLSVSVHWCSLLIRWCHRRCTFSL